MPKCEILDLLDSREFFTKKPSLLKDFGTVIKYSKFFNLVIISKFLHENFELAHAEYEIKKMLELDQ